MRRTVVEVDEDLLAEATGILHAATMKEAVNEALRFVVTENRRRQCEAIKSLGDWFAEKPFDKDDAWRWKTHTSSIPVLFQTNGLLLIVS